MPNVTAQQIMEDTDTIGDLLCTAAMVTCDTCRVRDADELRRYKLAANYRAILAAARVAADELALALTLAETL